MNEPKNAAKQEYFLIRVLEITTLVLAGTLGLYFLFQLFQPGTIILTIALTNSFPVYAMGFVTIGLIAATVLWRSYRIPPSIQETLVPYYQDLGYSTKKTLFHNLKVNISPELYFKIKITLYRRASDESCLFHLESMPVPAALQQEEAFQEVAERYFLKANLQSHQYSTSCELEEVHTRSLLLIRALEEFLQN